MIKGSNLKRNYAANLGRNIHGKPCDEASYGHQCDGQYILACENGAIVTFEDCAKRSKNYTCAGEENKAGCIMPCSGDSEKYICEYDEDYDVAFSARYVCYGNTAYIPDEGSIVMCMNGCNKDNTACQKIHAEEGNTCDKDTYTNKCDDRIAVACSNGVVVAIDCGEGNVCVENDDGRLSCKTPCTDNEEKLSVNIICSWICTTPKNMFVKTATSWRT